MSARNMLDKPLNKKRALDWALVLHAMDIPYEINRNGSAYSLEVPDEFRKEAERQLRLYERELAGREKDRESDASFSGAYSKVNLPLFFVIPVLFYVFQMFQLSTEYIPWSDAGYSSADLFRKGEWWRAITALTLHADEGHFIGNLITGGLIAFFLSALTGEGLGWLLIFFSGMLGNVLNSLVYQTGHNSIGFSTAVFGAIGILTGMELARKGRKNWRRIIFPLGGGLALFGLFGTDPSTDVSAHLMGFVCGLAIGLVCRMFQVRFGKSAMTRNQKPGTAAQIILTIAVVLVTAASWLMAFLV